MGVDTPDDGAGASACTSICSEAGAWAK